MSSEELRAYWELTRRKAAEGSARWVCANAQLKALDAKQAPAKPASGATAGKLNQRSTV